MINKNQLQVVKNDLSLNYEYCKVNYAGSAFDNVVLKNVNVCILPFETDDTGKIIQYLFLSRYYDFVKDSQRVSTLLYRHNEAQDDSNLDTVMRCVGDTMKIALTQDDVKRVFYLGEIELNNLLSGSIPCYGVNVTGLAKEISYKISDQMEMSLERVVYSNVLRGTSQDFLVASSVFMLLSYLS